MEDKKPKILIVDDEPFVVRIVQTNLKMEGYDVVVATDGEAALQMVHTEQPNLIILDVLLPKMNGWEVLNQLKADAATSHIPVMLLTVIHEMETLEQEKMAQAQRLLTKPFEPMDLITAVKQLLGETA
jgi:CheY-like chemotaxis protein